MSEQVMHPFHIMRNQTVIAGGVKKGRKEVVEVVPAPTGDPDDESEPVYFYPSRHCNYGIAKAIGLSRTDSDPYAWGDVSLMKHLIEQRDKAVDRAIMAGEIANDPLSVGKDIPETGDACKKNRQRNYDKYDVGSKALDVQIQANGELPQHVIGLLPSKIKGSAVAMELCETNLDWLAKAVHLEWPFSSNIQVRRSLEDLPTISAPNVKWYQVNNKMPVLGTIWHYSDGKQGKWMRRVDVDLDNTVLLQQLVDELAAKAQEEYNKNNVPVQRKKRRSNASSASTAHAGDDVGDVAMTGNTGEVNGHNPDDA